MPNGSGGNTNGNPEAVACAGGRFLSQFFDRTVKEL
jgi:hypothetical protein